MDIKAVIITNLLSFLLMQTALCKTISVGKSKHISTIHAGLALAENGDTILVSGGFYQEGNITITKAIYFSGIDHPVLDGGHKVEIISVKSNFVTVDGFRIQHAGRSGIDDIAGIKIYNCKNVSIINNTLDDTNFGIYTQFGTNCTIKNNQLISYGTEEFQSGNGIHCFRCDSMLIIGNDIKGHRDGIYFEFVTNSMIWRNLSTGNVRYGLHFMFSQNNNYITNLFKYNGSGVAVMYSHGVKMFNNYFEAIIDNGFYFIGK